MKNIIVAHILYDLRGGVASVAANIINELDCRGVNSVIVYVNDDPAMDAMLKHPHKKYKVGTFGSTLLHGVGLNEIYRQLCTDYPDCSIIIHAHNLQTVGLLARLTGIPLICTLHGYGNVGLGVRSKISYVLCKMTIAHIIANSGKVVAVSNAVAGYYDKRGNTILTIHNGIRSAYKREKQDKFTVAHIGNISKAKGWDKTCKGFSLVDKPLRQSMKFIYAGRLSGYTEEQVKTIVSDYGIENESSYLGFVNNASETVIPKTDVLILASENEGFSVVIIEALAQGIPVLGTPIAPIKEIIRDGDNGFLVTDPTSIALRLSQLYTDNELYNTMSLKAKKSYEELLTASKMTDQYMKFYEEVLYQKNK